MDKFLVFSVFIILVVKDVFSTVKRFTFVETLGGNTSVQDFGYSLVHDPNVDSFFVTGYVVKESGFEEAILVRYDTDGFILWTSLLRSINGLFESVGTGIEVSDDGGYVVTGYVDLKNGKDEELLLAKYDSQGSLIWIKTGSSPINSDSEKGFGIKKTTDGFFIVGEIREPSGLEKLLILKVDSNGELSFAKTLGGSSDEVGNSVDVMADGSFVVCGFTQLLEGANMNEILVAKYDSSGTLLWARAIGLTHQDQCNSIKATSDGGYILGGEQFWDVGEVFSYNAVIMKLDSDGVVTWAYSLGSSGENKAKSVLELRDGSGYILIGHSEHSKDLPSYPFIAKISRNGSSLEWTKFLNVSTSSGPSHFPDYGEGHAWDALELLDSSRNGTIAVSGYMGVSDSTHKDIFLSVIDGEEGCDWFMWNDSVYTDLKSDPMFNDFDCTEDTNQEDITSTFSLVSRSINFTVERFILSSHSLSLCEVCNANYYESNCNTTQCFGVWNNDTDTIICSDHGDCIYFDICECDGIYHGEKCDNIYKCHDIYANLPNLVCSGHGDCLDQDTCHCYPNYYGSFCNITSCFGIMNNETTETTTTMCSGHGKCSLFDRCECGSGYFGMNCNITTCFDILSNETELTCSGEGKCIDLNTCQCFENYFGTICGTTKCFGILSNMSTSVCSGHGDCFPYGICSCTDDYLQPNEGDADCSDFKCDGIWKDLDNMVCSTHGSCTAPDICDCDDHYEGELNFCSVWECFGEERGSGSECSTHGDCEDYDDCDCELNYFLSDCRGFTCFGLPVNDSNVCNGRKGECVDHDDCSCNDGYTSSDPTSEDHVCDTFSCYDILHTDKSACNGGGDCVEPNTCLCEENFDGKDCEECAVGWTGDDCKDEEGTNKLGDDPIVWLYLGLGAVGVVVVAILCLVCAVLVCLCAGCCLIIIPGVSWASICSSSSVWVKSQIGVDGKKKTEKRRKKKQKLKNKKKKKDGFKRLKENFKVEDVQEMTYNDDEFDSSKHPYLKIK